MAFYIGNCDLGSDLSIWRVLPAVSTSLNIEIDRVDLVVVVRRSTIQGQIVGGAIHIVTSNRGFRFLLVQMAAVSRAVDRLAVVDRFVRRAICTAVAVDTAGDVVIGSAVAHRTRSKIDRLAGRALVSLAAAADVQAVQVVAGQVVRGDGAVVAFRTLRTATATTIVG